MEKLECKKIIEELYNNIDNNQFFKSFEIFDDKILYFRDKKIIKNKDELKTFYLNERKLSGKHRA